MKRALVGAGGFAREIKIQMGTPNMISFVDEEFLEMGNSLIKPLSEFNPDEYEVIVAVGDPNKRKEIIKRLPANTKFFTFIHPTAQLLDDNIKIGLGSVICPNTILTTNIIIGNHSQLNLGTTIGHDCIIGSYFTTAPGVNVSGSCDIGDCVYLGTNCSIKEKIKICDNVTVGLNAGVVRSIEKSGVYVGIPVKRL